MYMKKFNDFCRGYVWEISRKGFELYSIYIITYVGWNSEIVASGMPLNGCTIAMPILINYGNFKVNYK